MGLADWLPGRRKRHAERIDAAHEAAITEQRERAADKEIRHAYAVAHKLAAHRRQGDIAFAKAFIQGHRRRAAQGAVQIVGPGMVGADD